MRIRAPQSVLLLFAIGFVAGMAVMSVMRDIVERPLGTTEILVHRKSTATSAVDALQFDERQTWPITYVQTPDTFLETVQSCEEDEHCRLFLHHVFKTGGTTIEKNMAVLWNQTVGNTCCNEKRMEVFREKRDYYCGESKFSSYQVPAEDIVRVVNECVNRNVSDKSLPEHRAVVLTTFREPIQMLMSFVSISEPVSSAVAIVAATLTPVLSLFPCQIHQVCNRNAKWRTQRVLDACKACKYEEYTDVWDNIILSVTDQLESAWKVSRMFVHDVGLSFVLPDTTRVLALDSSDITDFFGRFKPEHQLKNINLEDTKTCNFRMPSEMPRKLVHAQKLYRQLIANNDYDDR